MSSDNEVRILSVDEYPLWDDLVMKSPQGSIFHTSNWMVSCADLLSKKVVIYGYFSRGVLEGGCSLYEDRKFLFFPIATSTTVMSPYGGFIFKPFESSKVRENELFYNSIISSLIKEISSSYIYVSLTGSPAISDVRPFIQAGWKGTVYYTYHFDLDEDIKNRISRNVRRTIQKAEKHGIIVEKKFDPDVYWILHEKTYIKQGISSPVSRDFLYRMINYIQKADCGEMWIASTSDGLPIAAEIIIWDSNISHRWAAASDGEFSNLGATSLLLYLIFIEMFNKGFKKINLMAGNTPHLSKFISSFNPNLLPYYSVENFHWIIPDIGKIY